MNKAYYLSSCDTCKRILKELSWKDTLIDIKEQAIGEDVLEVLYGQFGSYESLFNKRARKFKDLKDTITSDLDYKKLILSHYTFIKRPILFINNEIFVGNSRSVVDKAKEAYDH